MKKAFTLLELVFVIVVAGILAAVMIPRTGSTNVQEAAVQLVSHIRYAQHLAMVDDKFDSTVGSNWYINRWQIVFNGNTYSIVSDNDTTFASDPSNGDANLRNINLNTDYSVTVALAGGCAGQTDISFDNLGRPMVGDISDDAASYVMGQLLVAQCSITITDASDVNDFSTILIEPETGYTRID